MITVTIGTIHRTYVVVETAAPPDYDGFGTFTLHTKINNKRLVLVEHANLTWQTARYQSGLHAAIVHDEPRWDKTAERVLWERLTGQEDASAI